MAFSGMIQFSIDLLLMISGFQDMFKEKNYSDIYIMLHHVRYSCTRFDRETLWNNSESAAWKTKPSLKDRYTQNSIALSAWSRVVRKNFVGRALGMTTQYAQLHFLGTNLPRGLAVSRPPLPRLSAISNCWLIVFDVSFSYVKSTKFLCSIFATLLKISYKLPRSNLRKENRGNKSTFFRQDTSFMIQCLWVNYG